MHIDIIIEHVLVYLMFTFIHQHFKTLVYVLCWMKYVTSLLYYRELNSN